MKTKYPGIYQDDKGKFYCSFYVVNGRGKKIRKLKRGFETIDEALMYKINFKNEDNYFNLTFDKAIKEYLSNVKARLKPATYRCYKNCIVNHITPFFSGSRIKNIGLTQIKLWKSEILKLKMADSYNQKIYMVFNNFFNYLAKNYELKNNPVELVGSFKKMNLKPKKNKHIISFDEFKLFCSNISNKEDLLLFSIFYFCGLRMGEVIGLCWKDIDFSNKKIKVNHQFCRFSHELKSPKNKLGEREILISDYLLNLLKEQKKNTFENENDYIFKSRKNNKNNPLSRTQVERLKNQYCDMANINRFMIKDFRDSHDSNSAQYVKNLDQLNALAQRSGHTKRIMLDIYMKAKTDSQKEIVNAMEEAFFNS